MIKKNAIVRKERAIALLLNDGHASLLKEGSGSGVRANELL